MDKVKQSTPLLWRWRRSTLGIMKRITATVAGAVIFGLSGQLPSYGAEAIELADVEQYIADGQQFEVRRIPGEISVKFQDDKSTAETAREWAASSGKPVEVGRSLARGAIVYRVSDDSPNRKAAGEIMNLLRSDETVRYAYPVFVNVTTGLKVFLNDRIVARFAEGVQLQDLQATAQFGLNLVETLSGSENIHVFEFQDPKEANPFQVCLALARDAQVLWAEPDMSLEMRKSVIPNDTNFGSQWHLRNTGQTSAFSDADVDADDAWNGSQGYGSPGIRIAIVDDGVQTAHGDLSANIIGGYDFYSGDNDSNPNGVDDHHGTAVAGLAAAEVNNATGVAGVAGKCKILPVRISENNVSPGVSEIYKALVYAADNADIINCSWGISTSSTITSGFGYAYSTGRAGKGCPIMVSSGNSASGEGQNSYTVLQSINLYADLGAGNYYALFVYQKDAASVSGDDCFWLADVALPNGTGERFDSGIIPTGWLTGGNANWSGSIDPDHAHGTSSFAWRSGAIGHNQNSWILTPVMNVTSTGTTLSYRVWVSSALGDVVRIELYDNTFSYLGFVDVSGGGTVINRTTAVSYPASLAYALGVGAATDFDYRSDYSQYGSSLDFVAPSSGGYGASLTTDRTGADGYAAGDYAFFGGTSAAAPTAAGVAALVLSKDGKLSRSAAVSKLTQTCDKVGPVTYTGTAPLTRNDYYGHGRINAYAAVSATTADTTAPTFSSATVANYRAVDVLFNEPMGEGAETPGNYTITAGQNTLSSNPSRVVRLTHSIYRLIWTSGEIATSGTVTIQAAAGIKDVAGNSLGANTSRSSTGTKRIVGVQCGGIPNDGPGYLYFGPYHMDTLEFQGNEYVGRTVQGISHYSNYTYNSIDTSGVTDPAPQSVYQSYRRSNTGTPTTLTYVIGNIAPGNKNIRLHFSENGYYTYGDQVFDVKVNGVTKLSYVDIFAAAGGVQYKAVTRTISNVTPDANGKFTIELVPVSSTYWTATVNAIEVLNP